ncbi:MAG TPA: DUF5663 domain-containing protein [Candidatus Saccharibacteria bacterium]|nr:DUF5663 domain-containing protein [Candidatus Saccharibacteria bacterium]
MFQLDDKFLQDIGLGEMPADQKQAFLEHIYSELELRVGTKLSEGLNDDQMAEFEAFIDRDADKVEQWFTVHMPNYAEQTDYQQLKSAAPQTVSPLDVLAEYGSLKWLELNRPDYKQVVATELEKLKSEIAANKDTILGQQ